MLDYTTEPDEATTTAEHDEQCAHITRMGDVTYIIPATGKQYILPAGLAEGRVQPEVCGALLHHAFQLFLALGWEIIIIAMLFQAVLDTSRTYTSSVSCYRLCTEEAFVASMLLSNLMLLSNQVMSIPGKKPDRLCACPNRYLAERCHRKSSWRPCICSQAGHSV